MGDVAEGDDPTEVGERGEIGLQPVSAATPLVGGGGVERRHALHGVGDGGAAEPELQSADLRIGVRGEAEVVERAVEEATGDIAAEGGAGAVGAVVAGRHTEQEESCVWVSEEGDGTRPVAGAAKRVGALDCMFSASEGGQAGAALAPKQPCMAEPRPLPEVRRQLRRRTIRRESAGAVVRGRWLHRRRWGPRALRVIRQGGWPTDTRRRRHR